MSRLPSLESLRVLEVAARHANFTRAADELHVTHGAISQRIKALEEELGVTLFDRRGRSMEVTEAGRTLADHVARGMAEIRRGVQAVAPEISERLIVSTIPAFATRWLIPRLPLFAKQHPEASVSLQTAMGLANMSRDGVEIAVRFGEGQWQGVRVAKLFDEYLFPVCSADLPEQDVPQDPRDLMRFPLLHDERQPWSLYFEALGLATPDNLRGPSYNDANVLLEAVASGHGIGLARATLVQPDLRAGRLRRLFDHLVKTRYSYYLIEPAGGVSSQAGSNFRGWLLAEAHEEERRLATMLEEAARLTANGGSGS